MGTGIIICGMNGAGKSTLGRALADSLGYHFIDVEDLYFTKTDPNYLYASHRTIAEVKSLLLDVIRTHENFVFAAVTGDYGDESIARFDYAVLIEVPKPIRMARVRERSYKKFGERMMPGGDLYETEERFFNKIETRAEDMAEEWVKCLSCPVIRVDGTHPIEENVELIKEKIKKQA